MGKVGTIVKATGTVLPAAAALLAAIRDNPALQDSVNSALQRLRTATSAETPKERFADKLKAIEACSDAVADAFPGAAEPAEWRRQVQALRMRGELAWSANHGKDRRKAMQALNAETADLLRGVNERLITLTNEPATTD